MSRDSQPASNRDRAASELVLSFVYASYCLCVSWWLSGGGGGGGALVVVVVVVLTYTVVRTKSATGHRSAKGKMRVSS